jgi:hypothetical protein
MALFRRVRIKTEIKVLAPQPRNKPSAAHVDNDDPYHDPELLRMLEAEKMLENELLLELQRTQDQREYWAEIEMEIEADAKIEAYLERESDAYFELQSDLYNEAAVEEQLNERMRLDELPSDSDEENSESHDSDDSDDIEDIDMDYRFS